MTPQKAPPQSRIVVLLGDVQRAEMRPLARWVEQLVTGACRLICCADLDSLLNQDPRPAIPIHKLTDSSDAWAPPLQQGERPDLIIVLQSWPDEFSSKDVSRVLRFAPLARLVVCSGGWCESLNRNRDVWPLAMCVPLWSAPSRIQHEWQLLQSDSPDVLPWTASREEVFAFDHAGSVGWFQSQTVQIDSPDTSYHQSLLELMATGGVQVTSANPTLLLWDADPWTATRAETLKQYRHVNPQVSVVALMDQLQDKVASDLTELGVKEIVLKLGFHRQLIERGGLTTSDQSSHSP